MKIRRMWRFTLCAIVAPIFQNITWLSGKYWTRFFLESSPLSILAIGAGSNLDGLAACIAIKYSGEKRDLRYQGVEKAEWPLLMSVADRFHQIRKDIADFEPGDLKPNYKINILSFPKSLSELETDKVDKFIQSGATSSFDSKLCVMFSNRNARIKKLKENELEKIKAILSSLNDCPRAYSTVDGLQIDDSNSEYKGNVRAKFPISPFTNSPLLQT